MITKIYNFKSMKKPTKNADAFSVFIFLNVLTFTIQYSVPSSCYWIRFTHSRSKKLVFLIISVAGLAWWYLNIYHTCDESKITPRWNTANTSINDVYSNTNNCMASELQKKLPKSFLQVQGLTLTWKYGSKLYWARNYSSSVNFLLSFLLHLEGHKSIWPNK